MDDLVKICGLSTAASVRACRDGGATHLGFIFFPKSPRNVTPDQAASLAKDKGSAQTVAVTVDAEDTFLDTIVTTMAPDMLQLHGGESVERVQELKARYGLPVMKALAIRAQGDMEKAARYDGVADLLLLDAKPPAGADLPGGNGVRFDWSLVEALTTRTPVLLSGGINPDNLADALTITRNAANSLVGIDVSSGVESAPGVKDDTTIAAFLAACRPATN